MRTRPPRFRGEIIVQFSLRTRTKRGARPGGGTSAEGDPHRQLLEAVGEIRPQPPWLSRQFKPLHAGHELLKIDAHLQACEMRAQAMMRAATAEGQLVGRVS